MPSSKRFEVDDYSLSPINLSGAQTNQKPGRNATPDQGLGYSCVINQPKGKTRVCGHLEIYIPVLLVRTEALDINDPSGEQSHSVGAGQLPVLVKNSQPVPWPRRLSCCCERP